MNHNLTHDLMQCKVLPLVNSLHCGRHAIGWQCTQVNQSVPSARHSYLGCHVMGSCDDVVGIRRMDDSSHQLLVKILPVVNALTIIYAEAIHTPFDRHIQHLQLFLKEGRMAPIWLSDKACAFGHPMLISTWHPAVHFPIGLVCTCLPHI